MKITFASQSFYPHIGGVSTYLLNLLQSLQEYGHEVAEVHLRAPLTSGEEDIEGIKVYRVPKEPLDRKLLAEYSKFKEAVYNECHEQGKLFDVPAAEMPGFDAYNKINIEFGEQVSELLVQSPSEVVDIHDFQLLFAYKYVPRGTPTLLRWHIPFTTKMSKHLKEFLISHMNNYDAVVFSTPEYVKAAVKSGLDEEKAKLIYPIANTKHFFEFEPAKQKRAAAQFRKNYRLPKDSKIILCVQRIDAKAGHEQLIKAMSRVVKEHPDARLVFVGGQSMSGKIANSRLKYELRVKKLIEKLGLKKYVKFTGNIDYWKLPSVYNAADVVALCSKFEGFGLSITEGMCCGKPIIGTKQGGLLEQIEQGKNGYLVDVGDWKETAKRLSELLEDEALMEKMGAYSKEIVDKKFKVEVGVENHVALYGELLKEKETGWSLRMKSAADFDAIVLDYDRTLTDKPGVVRPEVIEALKKFGKKLILATGRDQQCVEDFNYKYPIWDATVAENGTVVFLPKEDRITLVTSTALNKIRNFFMIKRLEGIMGRVIISFKDKFVEEYRPMLKKHDPRIEFIKNVDDYMVLPKGVDKGTGVKLALEQLGIDPEKTIVVGDGENDVALFNVPGFRVAVANAIPEMKKLADQVTKKPRSAGVLEIIEELKK